MKQGSSVRYESAAGVFDFARGGHAWITATPDFSSNQMDLAESRAAGQVGGSITGQAVRPRTVTVSGSLVGGDLPQLRRRLLRAVAPGMPGRLVVTEDGESWYLEGAPSKTPFITAGAAVQDFQFTFRAGYPYWRSTTLAATDIAGLTGLFRFPFSTAGGFMLSRFSQSFYRQVDNTGDVPVAVEVRFYARGRVVRPRLYSVTARAGIALETTLATGEEFVADTTAGQRGALLKKADGTSENGFRHLAVESDLALALLPGGNLLLADAEEGRTHLRVSVVAPRGVRSGM